MTAGLPMTTLPVVAPRRSRDDYAFLPAALEITETPLSPIRGSMILTICGLVAATLALGYFGTIDVIAAAQGKIQPVGRTKMVQPIETGRVLRLAVANGQSVKTGEVLITLDARESEAEEAALRSNLHGQQGEADRRRAAQAAARDDLAGDEAPAIAWDDDVPDQVRAREGRVLESDLAQLTGQIAGADAKIERATAEIARLRGTIAAQEALTSTSKERLDMRSELLAREAGSKASVIDAQEAYQTQIATLATEQGQLGETEAARRLALRERDQAFRAFRADNAAKLADVEKRADEETQRLARARLRTGAMTIRAPADGRVEGLTVTSVGQVVSAGEPVMQIVPAGADLEIEAYLPNGDAAFVHPGQSAAVKIAAYPFAEYGTVEAHVVRIAGDAIPLPEADGREGNPAQPSHGPLFGGAQRVQNLVYPVTLALERQPSAAVPLAPGMAVTVEMRTGSRRILSYVLSPLMEIAGSALRER